MRKILVAVDGSDTSQKAVGAAIEIAESAGAEVKVLNVFAKDVFEARIAVEKRPIDEYADDARQIAVDISEPFKKRNVKLSFIGRVGYPAEVILAVAEFEKVDLVVVGFTGLHGMGRIMALGSVSRRVVENSKVPVLVVPHQK